MKRIPTVHFFSSLLVLLLFTTQSRAQTPEPWLVDIDNEISQMEENIASCRADIADFQAEIDELIKNTPSPITGTPTEDRIRELQKKRALWSCWGDQAEKKLNRLKAIRSVLIKRYGTASPVVKRQIQKRQEKVKQAEKKANDMKQAGEKLGDTINEALNEHK